MTDNWNILDSAAQWKEILEESSQQPVAIFKHSTRCPVSFSVKKLLEGAWDYPVEKVKFYFLDLIQFRGLSNQIAQDLNVVHESPQLILIKDGQAVYHESHFGIRMESIKEVLV